MRSNVYLLCVVLTSKVAWEPPKHSAEVVCESMCIFELWRSVLMLFDNFVTVEARESLGLV